MLVRKYEIMLYITWAPSDELYFDLVGSWYFKRISK